jgi:hypothetical protein
VSGGVETGPMPFAARWLGCVGLETTWYCPMLQVVVATTYGSGTAMGIVACGRGLTDHDFLLLFYALQPGGWLYLPVLNGFVVRRQRHL